MRASDRTIFGIAVCRVGVCLLLSRTKILFCHFSQDLDLNTEPETGFVLTHRIESLDTVISFEYFVLYK